MIGASQNIGLGSGETFTFPPAFIGVK